MKKEKNKEQRWLEEEFESSDEEDDLLIAG